MGNAPYKDAGAFQPVNTFPYKLVAAAGNDSRPLEHLDRAADPLGLWGPERRKRVTRVKSYLARGRGPLGVNSAAGSAGP